TYIFEADTTIDASLVTNQGFWYQVIASNETGMASYPENERHAVIIEIEDFDQILETGVSYARTGIPADQWYTISLPFEATVDLEDESVLGHQDFNQADEPTNWRVQSWNAVDSLLEDENRLENERGYFIKHKLGHPANIIPADNFNAFTNRFDTFDTIQLEPGWNLIGWPFAYSSPYAWIDNLYSPNDSLWMFNGSEGWVVTDTLRPFGGYAIHNKHSTPKPVGDLLSIIPVDLRSARANQTDMAASPASPAETDWKMRITAYTTRERDTYNFLGVCAGADEGLDRYDVFEPPAIGQSPALYFVRPKIPGPTEDEGLVHRLSFDIQSTETDGHAWDLVLDKAGDEQPVYLHWEPGEIPPDLKMVLYDLTLNHSINGPASDYRFDSHRQHKFKIFVGSPTYIEREVDQLESLLPQSFELAQNYPNPFNPITTINFALPRSMEISLSVFNVSGQLVAILSDGYFETGRYAQTWDGRNKNGLTVASGVYFYRLQGAGFTRTKRMLFLK
ncbi:MAG: T9SS type A sorting domain-containing protein, partial [Planctomycetes bacterium]|nr:T9SS type A sorting domain-containing protein [Planctomycetota bacterium]